MIVLDTHALLWWVNDPATLSEPAKTAIDAAVESRSVHVSCISSWEIALLVERGRLRLALDVRDWLCRCEALPFLTFVAVNNAIAVESVRLPDFPHADPADRIIAATALSLGAALVTKDDKLRNYPHVKTIW
ncbi:type II toxin-antitoxin system VapC family toxin [Oryzomonas sagensis]|uniref:Type II toxin-antitoxin system VapC family toxin n=1 Tax=Oryzomonas sagensis TaxID=2603857 RepID=A0ABQ6TTU3_9BACT|nr:type II toxin-antitoxin system VapC family toxin [Oryzomonas sagensis]KAB0672439.1 type II toxin-antitoxin system VapC family toxin [Oryzomonas sagensis]